MADKWLLTGTRVTGASHVKRSVACQDSFSYKVAPVIMAVADGHGGKAFCRSRHGSRLACSTALHCATEYTEKVFAIEPANIVKEVASGKFIKVLIETWHQSVLDDVAKTPYSNDELELLKIATDCNDRYRVIKGYGTTLLLVVILDDKILSWQIGDGDILFYDSKGGVRRPIPDDSRHIANETTSLCLKDAEQDFKFNITYTNVDGGLPQYMPELIMLSTDGYSNSFSSRDDFYKAAEDFYDICRTDGFETINHNLKTWLDETSQSGSGDDITLVLAYSKPKKGLI